MFSTMITELSTMIPKSIAPIDSRLADSPRAVEDAHREEEGQRNHQRHDPGARQVAEEDEQDGDDQAHPNDAGCARRCGS